MVAPWARAGAAFHSAPQPPPHHTNEKPQPPPHSVRSQARGCAYMCGSWMTAVAQDRGALLRYMMTGARAT